MAKEIQFSSATSVHLRLWARAQSNVSSYTYAVWLGSKRVWIDGSANLPQGACWRMLNAEKEKEHFIRYVYEFSANNRNSAIY